MNYNIALLKGDGIGPEIVDEAVKVLDKIGEKFSHKFKYVQGYLGGESIDKYGIPLSDETVQVCRESDAILLGAIGGPKWDNIDPQKRPERGLLAIRKELGVYTNLRPATLFKPLKSASPLKEEIIGEGLDIMIVRELTGGLYFGHREYSEEKAYDTLSYTRPEIERITKKAFEIAKLRNKKLTSVDKHNVLDTSKLWRKIVEEIAKDYPEVEVSHMYVDNAAMQLISNPGQFDVILTENMFGDILSDEEYEDVRKSLENVTDRLAIVPLSTREFLVKCLRRSSRSKYSHRREELIVNADEIRQAISVEGRRISRKTIAEHIKILENYGFACFEEIDNRKTGRIIFSDDASVLYTAHRIAKNEQTERSDGFLSTLETILVRLDFSLFEKASIEQIDSGKRRPSRKNRPAKNSRHTK